MGRKFLDGNHLRSEYLWWNLGIRLTGLELQSVLRRTIRCSMAVFFSVQALAGGECSAWISLNMTCSSASYLDEQPIFSGHNFLSQSIIPLAC